LASVKLLKRKFNHKDRYINQEVDAIYSLINGFHDEVMTTDGVLTVSETGNLCVNGNLKVTGTTNLQGSTTLDGTLDIMETVTIENGDLNHTVGNTNFGDGTITVFGGSISVLLGNISTTGDLSGTRLLTDTILERTIGNNVTVATGSDFIVTDILKTNALRERTPNGDITITQGNIIMTENLLAGLVAAPIVVTTTINAAGGTVTIDDNLHVTENLTVDGTTPAATLNQTVRIEIGRTTVSGGGTPDIISISVADMKDYLDAGQTIEGEFSVRHTNAANQDISIQCGTSGGADTGNVYSWRARRWTQVTDDETQNISSDTIVMIQNTADTYWTSGKFRVFRTDQTESGTNDAYNISGEVMHSDDADSFRVGIGTFGGIWNAGGSTLELVRLLGTSATSADFEDGSYLALYAAVDL